MSDPITDEWLKEVGFKWHELERQTSKHWLLWLGDAEGQGRLTSYEDIGIELASGLYANRNGEIVGSPDYFCWFRSDAAGRYHRFIHVRRLTYRHEVIALIEAISGQPWNPENHLYGSVRTPTQAAIIRKRDQEMDIQLQRQAHHWSEIEKDDSRGRALPEHFEAHEKARTLPRPTGE